jgi:uncharacterized membrane protein
MSSSLVYILNQINLVSIILAYLIKMYYPPNHTYCIFQVALSLTFSNRIAVCVSLLYQECHPSEFFHFNLIMADHSGRAV